MRLLVLDVETTGVDPTKDAVCEIAGAIVDSKRMKVVEEFDYLVNPGIRIQPEAMGIHHILDRHVADKPDLGSVLRKEVLAHWPFIMVAHNRDFDASFLKLEKHPGICTYRVAKHLWPMAPTYSNQALRYWLKLFKEPEPRAMPQHRAKADVWVTSHILLRQLQERPAEGLLELTKAPILLRTVGFGKHRGEEWANVPKSYLDWILRQDFDRDTLHTAQHYV